MQNRMNLDQKANKHFWQRTIVSTSTKIRHVGIDLGSACYWTYQTGHILLLDNHDYISMVAAVALRVESNAKQPHYFSVEVSNVHMLPQPRGKNLPFRSSEDYWKLCMEQKLGPLDVGIVTIVNTSQFRLFFNECFWLSHRLLVNH